METGKEVKPASSRYMPSSLSSSSPAPWYDVPRTSVVSVEHPFIIKNIDKGIVSLGGPDELKDLSQDLGGSIARLYLHPGDRMFKPLKSANVCTKNVLLKVTVPKKVRLRRKRGLQVSPSGDTSNRDDLGSEEKRTKQVSLTRGTQSLIRSMRDNPTKYQVQAVGSIVRTHRFRGMPDFVVSTATMPFMKKMREHILPFDYEKMKGFTFDKSKGVKPNTEIIPPPLMTHFTHPFNYSYRQNPSVKQIIDKKGNVTTTNVYAGPKLIEQPLPFDIPDIPISPSLDLPPVKTLDQSVQRLIASARRLMEERPIFTRRALANSIPDKDWETVGPNSAKRIFQYCGYSFASGPWRDAIIRFGVDPRKDPGCRIYQTMMFMLENEPKDSRAKYNRSKADPAKNEQVLRKESHLFDGQTVSKDGKVWQVCDISEPLLHNLFATSNLRKECHIESDGWYHNGTWAKARIIMKAKIQAILLGLPQQETAYAKVVREMPDIIRRKERSNAKLGEDATRYEMHLASLIRASSFTYGIAARERTASQEGGYGDDDEEEEQDPPIIDDEVIDPRLTDAALSLNRLEEGAAQEEALAGGMDVDLPRNDRIMTP